MRMQLKTDQNDNSMTFNYALAGRMFKRDYRLKVNSPSAAIADSDTFTFDRSPRIRPLLLAAVQEINHARRRRFLRTDRIRVARLTIVKIVFVDATLNR